MPTLDVDAAWDFADPQVSEARFQTLAASATGDAAAILETQIARTYGLRRRFDEARSLLARLEPGLAALGPEAQVRYHLEYGRSWASATHQPAELTPAARTTARAAYLRAYEIAREHRLDDLAIDALHMLPMADTDAASGLHWTQLALEVMLQSDQPKARKWEASLRNNLGYYLHGEGRYAEALAMFQSNVPVTERAGNATQTRIAHWMVAWTLRSLGRLDESLAIQLRLEQENARESTPDPYVFEELAQLYRALGDDARGEHYSRLQQQP